MKTYRIYSGGLEYWISAKRFRVDEFGIHFLNTQDQQIGYAPVSAIVTLMEEDNEKIPEFPEDKMAKY